MIPQDTYIRGEYLFRGVEYNISVQLNRNGSQMTLSVEDKMLGDQWKAAFDANYIEDLTKKTGNFKQFSVFVSMLESALDKSTDSVSLDLLTLSDLEALRNRKTGKAKTRHKTPVCKQQENKRYLILIYSVEFDRIHYPLPLPFLGKPDPAHLQQLVHELNEEICKLRSGRNPSASSLSLEKLKKDYDLLMQEKSDLCSAYELLKSESKSKTDKIQYSKEVKILKKVVQNLEHEMLKEKNKFQRQLSKKTSECKRLTNEVKELSAKERSLQLRLKSLTNELNTYKRSRTPAPSGGYSSRTSNYARSNSRNSTNGRKSVVSFRDRSSSATSQQGSYRSNRRSTSNSKRPPSKSSFRKETPKSRTPTPQFRRFNPTKYNEDRKKKLQESEERRKRQIRGRLHEDSSYERGRTRSRNKTRAPLYPRSEFSRNSSLESRNSSNRGSRTRSYQESDDDIITSDSISRHHKQGSKRRDTDMDEIDARLDALQQYMKEIEDR